MRTPMPSPRGTNYARLYLEGAAYDAASGLNPTFNAAQRGAIRTAFARAGVAFDEAQFLQAIKRENAREDARDEGGLASRIMAAISASGDFDNDEVAAIEQALANAGIPYKMVGGRRFFDRVEVRIVLDYLRTISHPDNNSALLSIINTPARKVGDATVAAFVGQEGLCLTHVECEDRRG